ncbi:MAG: carboxypeptidase M32 [Actinobacteria bacterium]|nr:carboxypeptidase M32 [Actinomycetota bacterium]
MRGPGLEELRGRLAEIADLEAAAGLLEWDLQTMMPRGGADARGQQLATLRALAHKRSIDARLGELLAEASTHVEGDTVDACLVRVALRDHDRAARVPVELTAETTRAASTALVAWTAAREADDFAAFRPHLDRMIELKRRYVDCFDAADDPYDVLLEDYEPGLRAAAVETIFARLLPELQRLLHAAGDAELEPFEVGPYPPEAQDAVSREVARAFGVDDAAFRLDPSVHPFCQAVAIDDIRLTTRYEPSLAGHSLFSTMHEAGHGLYEHGVDPALGRSPLGTGASTALHESQSRLWENVVGRSFAFWRWFYPRMQVAHPELLRDVPVERFHRALVRPRASLVRVSADEVSYGLHVILRFELERALLSGALATTDLPEAWNARFEELLGIRPPDDRLGCMQDVHWAEGLFGYFPSYQLGNVLAVQIWQRVLADIPDADDQIGQGRFEEIHGWLRERLYRLGRSFTPAETLERLGCGPLDPEPYLAYLRERTGL